MQDGDQRDWEKLIDDILESPELVHSKKHGRRLLRVLFKHQHDEAPFVGSALSAEVYGGNASDQAEQPIRTLCQDLRKKLWRYSGTDVGQGRKWTCQFPVATARYGYRLLFVDQSALPGITGAFWQAHRAEGKSVVILYSEPLFFRDLEGNKVYRWFDVNEDETTAVHALDQLRKIHTGVESKGLHPCFLYVPTGEMAARDHLAEWFAWVAGIKASWRPSREEDSTLFAATCPVMVGGPQGNSLMRELLESKRCAGLHYRYDRLRYGVTLLNGDSNGERRALETLPSENVRHNGGKVEFIDHQEAEGFVLGVVTRMPNPYGKGAVTMISSYNTVAVEQIALMLTNDSILERVMGTGTWNAGVPFPRFAQALFSVRLGFFKVDSEGGEPELIGWHVYSDSGVETNLG